MIAVVVEDRWQGRGVGKLLLFELAGDFVPLPEDLEFVGAISQQHPRA
jgi:hypothetical protein